MKQIEPKPEKENQSSVALKAFSKLVNPIYKMKFQ